MPAVSDSRYQEADLLARAVENVFRKLIRFLVGRITLVKLQEMIRQIYVEESERVLRKERPGRNVPLTRLALHTGLDTRTLTRVREQLALEENQYRRQFLAELTPESAVVEAWADRVARGAGPGDPAVLEYGSEDAPFEQLLHSTISMRGITTKSIIQRLVDTNSIEHDRENRRLRLLVDYYSPYLSDDEPNIINAAFSAISNLISTIQHNVDRENGELLFQRQAWTFRLSPEDRARFRSAMRKMLEQYESAAVKKIQPFERSSYGDGLVTAGVGFYFFEEEQPG